MTWSQHFNEIYDTDLTIDIDMIYCSTSLCLIHSNETMMRQMIDMFLYLLLFVFIYYSGYCDKRVIHSMSYRHAALRRHFIPLWKLNSNLLPSQPHPARSAQTVAGIVIGGNYSLQLCVHNALSVIHNAPSFIQFACKYNKHQHGDSKDPQLIYV